MNAPQEKTAMQHLIAYHANEAEKTAILAQLQAHHDADEIVQGQYWEHGKGCAVACTIHGSDHAEYEPRFGIPRILARLEDRIFEGLTNEKAKLWPMRFMGAIRPGADLSGVWPKFVAWLMVDETHGVIRHAKTDAQRAIIKEIAELSARGESDLRIWCDVRDRAWEVRRAAYTAYAAYDAAYAAYDAAADDAAYAAAYAAAAADADAAYAAYDAAARRAGARLARRAAEAAGETAGQAHYSAQADKLVELLAAA
jgi:hypothetical protein